MARKGGHRLAKSDLGGSTKCTPARIEAIVELASEGLSQESIALKVGISPSLLRRWMRKGRKGIEPYATLYREWAAMAAEVERIALAKIRSAVKPDGYGDFYEDWRAAAWLLERLHRDRYGKPIPRKELEKEFFAMLPEIEAGLERRGIGKEAYVAFLEVLAEISGADMDDLEDDEDEDEGSVEGEVVR